MKPDTQTPIQPLLLDRKAVAAALSLSTKAIDFLIADGRLAATRFGSRVLVHRSEVERIAASGIEGRIRP